MFVWFLKQCQRNNTLILLFFGLLLGYISENIFDSLYPSVKLLTDIHKCPACYGLDFCNNIYNDDFKIKPFDIHSALSHLFFSKNVFYGTMGETKIVIKKLAHDIEFEMFDKMLCEDTELQSLCWKNKNNDKISHNNIDYIYHMENEMAFNLSNNNSNGLILCPTTKHFQHLLDRSLIKHFNDLANLWTVIKINPEPIVLTILSADENWPVPKYYGACGRIIVESYVGPPLTLYYKEPWLRRAKIAIDLLEAARIFTFGSAEYAYYLTDISSDNIAIDNYDKPKFIDLENIFILNKNISVLDQPKNWYDFHVSNSEIECENCFVYSPMDICSHQISDHNYYAICHNILYSEKNKNSNAKGFLHDIPHEISDNYSDLKTMLNECAIPTVELSRVIAAKKLQAILIKIINDMKQE